MMKRLLLLVTLFTACGLSVSAQDLFYRKNLANIKVDNLSQEQVLRFQQQIKTSSMSEYEVANYLRSKGLSREEIEKLKKRMGGLGSSTGSSVVGNFEVMDQYFRLRDSLQMMNMDSIDELSKSYVRAKELPDSVIFGAELFANSKMSFISDGQLATPANYIVGPGDVLSLMLFGYQELNNEIKVLPDGKINIPYAGVISVAGLTIEQTTKKISKALESNGYATISSGESKLVVSVAAFRSFQVTVIGGKNSGNFLVPSVASVFHVLHLAGGPSKKGTYREIEVIRKGQVVQRVDLYKFLVKGDVTENINLRENDVINIPVYGNRVMVKGEIKRPGLFEVLPGESLDTLLAYAGGFTDIAWKNSVHIVQIGENEYTTRNINKEGFKNYFPNAGDVITVGSIVDRYSSRVVAGGAFMRPGYFGWEENMKLSKLIELAGGPRENALMTRGLIYRSLKDNSKFYLRFNPADVLEGKSDEVLVDGDSVVLGDKSIFFPAENVSVAGEVNAPGVLVYGVGMTAQDAIFLAGGLRKNALPNRIEITRRVEGTGKMEVAKSLEAATDAELMIKADEVKLEPLDVVIIRPNPGYQTQRLIELQGEFAYPGTYALLRQQEKLSEVVQRAGGLNELADINAAFLIRERLNPTYLKVHKKMQMRERTDKGIKSKDLNMDAENDLDVEAEGDSLLMDTIAINLQALMGRNAAKYDLILQEGDRLEVRKKRNTVSVKGEVNASVTINYNGRKLKPYLRDAGGTLKNADKRRIFVVEPSGKAQATRTFLFVKKYPKVTPGSVVVVPSKITVDEMQRDPARMAATASVLASASGLLYILLSIIR